MTGARATIVPHVPSIMTGAILIAALAFASRLLGLLRDRILASMFGAGPTLDAYYTAFRIPDALFSLLGIGALSAAFLPVYVRLRRGDVDRAGAFAASILSDTVILLTVCCGVGALAAQPLYAILAPGFTPAQLALTVAIGRVVFLATFLLGCSAIVGGILQAESRFFPFAVAPLTYNAGIILGALAFAPSIGPIGLAWGVVLGAALHFLVQWIAAQSVGFRPHWSPTWRDPEVVRTAALLVPRILGLASLEVRSLAVTAIASTLTAGTLTAFTFAQNIQMVPVSLFGIAFAIAAFPSLAASASAGDHAMVRAHLSTAIRQIALLTMPAVVVLLTLKAQVVRVLLGAGAFDWEDTVRTIGALEAFGFGLVATALLPLLTRTFAAFEDTRTPFMVAFLANGIAVGAAFVLGHAAGARGLAFAVSIAAMLEAVLLIAILRRRLRTLDGRRIMRSFVTFGIAAFAMSVVIQIVKPIVAAWTGTDTFVGIGLQGLLAALCGGAAYLGVGILLHSEEITACARALHRRALWAARLPFGGADEVQG